MYVKVIASQRWDVFLRHGVVTYEQFLKFTVGLCLGLLFVCLLPFCSRVVCFSCVSFGFFSTKPRDHASVTIGHICVRGTVVQASNARASVYDSVIARVHLVILVNPDLASDDHQPSNQATRFGL